MRDICTYLPLYSVYMCRHIYAYIYIYTHDAYFNKERSWVGEHEFVFNPRHWSVVYVLPHFKMKSLKPTEGIMPVSGDRI